MTSISADFRLAAIKEFLRRSQLLRRLRGRLDRGIGNLCSNNPRSQNSKNPQEIRACATSRASPGNQSNQGNSQIISPKIAFQDKESAVSTDASSKMGIPGLQINEKREQACIFIKKY